MNTHLYNHKYSTDIIGKSKTTTIHGMDWQDIAQELDIALWKNLGKYSGKNQASERTFAQKVMKNKILDLAKSINRQKRFIDRHHLLFSQLEESEWGLSQLESAVPVLGGVTYE